jgi:hypothetical protein
LTCDLQPFSVVENVYFKKMINTLDPRYRIPDRHKVKNYIIEMFEEKHKSIKNYIEKVSGKISITTDMWTSTLNNESFLGITIHYIDST